VIPVLVGFVLLSAAALKVFYPADVISRPFDSNWFPMVLAELELFLGLWLWTGLWAAASRLTMLALFSAFAVFNWTEAHAGAVSCACFGGIGLSPWMALGLDGVVVALLLCWRPSPAPIGTQGQLAFGTLVFSLGAIIAIWPGDTKRRNGLLEVFPRMLDLGGVPQGTAATSEFVVRNTSSESVSISQLESSCPCLHISLPAEPVAPGAEVRGEATLDMSREPNFTGNLAVELRAKTGDNKRAFGMVVRAEVHHAN
jgi:hypothetical protein